MTCLLIGVYCIHVLLMFSLLMCLLFQIFCIMPLWITAIAFFVFLQVFATIIAQRRQTSQVDKFASILSLLGTCVSLCSTWPKTNHRRIFQYTQLIQVLLEYVFIVYNKSSPSTKRIHCLQFSVHSMSTTPSRKEMKVFGEFRSPCILEPFLHDLHYSYNRLGLTIRVFQHLYEHLYNSVWLRKQENRAVARKPRDAAAIFFGLKFADDIHYKFKSCQASKARLHSSKHTGTKPNLRQKSRKMAIQGHSKSRDLESVESR